MVVAASNTKTKPSKRKPVQEANLLTLPVFTKEGKCTTRKVALSSEIFSKENDHVLSLNVIHSNNKKRQGSSKTKDKSEVNASTRKLFRQKGRGSARKGSKKSGILRGGGRFFGPRVRTYEGKMNKQEKKLAHLVALSEKSRNQQIVIVEDFSFGTPSTKNYLGVLRALQVQKEKILWVIPEIKKVKNIVLSSNNVQKNKVITANQINAYDLLYATKLLIFESALPLVENKFA